MKEKAGEEECAVITELNDPSGFKQDVLWMVGICPRSGGTNHCISFPLGILNVSCRCFTVGTNFPFWSQFSALSIFFFFKFSNPVTLKSYS